jgi:hypothetical protein
MLNEYPKEFIDSIIKPSRSNCPSSHTVCQGMVNIPYVRVSLRNSDALETNVRTIFKTEHTLCGTLMKTGLVRVAQ